MPPLVSVLVPVFNRAVLLQETVASILAQDYPNVEIVISDDGSTDATPEVIRRLSREHRNIVPVFAQRNRGISFALNAGFERCSGEYIVMFDSDDIMLPGKLTKQVDVLQRRPELGICSHDVEMFDSVTGKTILILKPPAKCEGGIEIAFATQWLLGPVRQTQKSSFMARREFFLAAKYDTRLRIWNEWLHMVECLALTGMKWGHIPETLSRYRKNHTQATNNREYHDVGFEELLMIQAIVLARYPQFAGLARNRLHFVRFQHLLFDWHPPAQRSQFERAFREDAGLLRWLYLRFARLLLRSGAVMQITRPARQWARALFTRSAQRV